MRAVKNNRDPRVAWNQAIPKSRHGRLPGKDVDVLALNAKASILCNEATIVFNTSFRIARQAIELGNI